MFFITCITLYDDGLGMLFKRGYCMLCRFLIVLSLCLIGSSCDKASVDRTLGVINPILGGSNSKGSSGLTNNEIISGLRSALQVGSKNASSSLHRKNAYLGNPLIKILFPKEAKIVADTLKSLGMSSLVNQVVTSLNRAAEAVSYTHLTLPTILLV